MSYILTHLAFLWSRFANWPHLTDLAIFPFMYIVVEKYLRSERSLCEIISCLICFKVKQYDQHTAEVCFMLSFGEHMISGDGENVVKIWHVHNLGKL